MELSKRSIGIGLIGTGYLGKAYTLGYRSAPIVFGPLDVDIRLEIAATSRPETAAQAQSVLGFARSTTDWREVVADPAVDIVIVNTPNWLHKDQALAALAAGKHVHCEKPLGLDGRDALEMRSAALEAGVKTIVGFNYRQNPATCLAREIIENGEIGAITAVRALHNEDYFADADSPFNWKCLKARSGGGASVDIGAHIIAIILYLAGPIAALTAHTAQTIPTRPRTADSAERLAVETEDIARLLCRFASGATGVIECNRTATGRKMQLDYEITGTRGSIAFSQERMSELRLYRAEGPPGRRGFKTLFVNEHHPHYAAFGMGPGHGIGFNDQKIIECHEFLRAILDDRPASPDFTEAAAVSLVTDAVLRSASSGSWVDIERIEDTP